MTFRTRLFLTSLVTAALTLVVATVLTSWSVRRAMGDRLGGPSSARHGSAETLSTARPPAAPSSTARRMRSAVVNARVTLVASDGSVLGDSELDGEALAAVENHGERPEILQARQTAWHRPPVRTTVGPTYVTSRSLSTTRRCPPWDSCAWRSR